MEAIVIWLKVIHISALLFWSAALLYLPGLLAAHPGTVERRAFHRLRKQTRIAYLGVGSPAAVIAITSGSLLIYANQAYGIWLVLKLVAVALMVTFHAYLGSLLSDMRAHPVERSAGALRALVVIPTLLISVVLYLVIGKPL